MTSHDLKVWPEHFAALERGDKLFELRKDDRGFKVGDWLKLREWAPPDLGTATPGHFTGARCLRRISYVLPAPRAAKLAPGEQPLGEGWVILGLMPPFTDLGVSLKGKRLFLGSIEKPVIREAQAYLHALSEFLESQKAIGPKA